MTCKMMHVTARQTVTFELTHENKSCSACAKDQNKYVTDTVTDTNKDTQVPSFCLTFRHFLLFIGENGNGF